MSRLLQMFTPSDPFTNRDIQRIEQYIDSQIDPFYKALELFPAKILVGSSGSFDTYRTMIVESKNGETTQDTHYWIDINDYNNLHEKLISLPQKELVHIPGMDHHRVDMISLSSIFVNFLLRKTSINKIVQSSYSLKEGVIFSMVHNEKIQ